MLIFHSYVNVYQRVTEWLTLWIYCTSGSVWNGTTGIFSISVGIEWDLQLTIYPLLVYWVCLKMRHILSKWQHLDRKYECPWIEGLSKKFRQTQTNPPSVQHIYIYIYIYICVPCWQPRSMQTPITIVNPVMGVWPKDAPDQQEEITMKFVAGTTGAVSDGSFRS